MVKDIIRDAFNDYRQLNIFTKRKTTHIDSRTKNMSIVEQWERLSRVEGVLDSNYQPDDKMLIELVDKQKKETMLFVYHILISEIECTDQKTLDSKKINMPTKDTETQIKTTHSSLFGWNWNIARKMEIIDPHDKFFRSVYYRDANNIIMAMGEKYEKGNQEE